MALHNPRQLGFCRGNSWGYVFVPNNPTRSYQKATPLLAELGGCRRGPCASPVAPVLPSNMAFIINFVLTIPKIGDEFCKFQQGLLAAAHPATTCVNQPMQ